MRVTTIIAALIGLGAIGGGSLVAINADPLPPPANTLALAEAPTPLQRLATDACRCEQRAGASGKKECWAKFDEKLPPDKSNESFTACDPVSTSQRCGGTGDTIEVSPGVFRDDVGPCAITGYNYAASDGKTILLCSREDASAVEKAWNGEAQPDASGRISTPITDQLARDIAAGKSVRPIQGVGGCNS